MSVAQGSLNPQDVSNILQQTLAELEKVKKQLKNPFASKETVSASLIRLENDIKVQSTALAKQSAEASADPASPGLGPLRVTYTRKPAPRPMEGGGVPSGSKSNAPLPLNADKVTASRSRFLVNNPQSEFARDYLQSRFGVPKNSTDPRSLLNASKSAETSPSYKNHGGGGGPIDVLSPASPVVPSSAASAAPSPPPRPILGKTAAAMPTIILPRAVRDDAHMLPSAELADIGIEKGLLDMVNRGLLPAKADLSPALCGDGGPYESRPVAIRPADEKFRKPPSTTSMEDALRLRADFKLDLITPVVKPGQTPKMMDEAVRLSMMTLDDKKIFANTTGSGGGRPMTTPRSKLPAGLSNKFHVAAAAAMAAFEAAGEFVPASTSAAAIAAGVGVGGSGNGNGNGNEYTLNGTMRPFESLMDTYSLHNIIIRKGVVLRDTPEFESFRRLNGGEGYVV
eukprot:CAMPEP_0175040420 /NCGR_PEP_ID=MMETSP0052_2-20121109/1250_1 /TAXON_ID=51329 ORGANISM="Polytomella parva, Strain SAG 63-3" /NCGR_SAMPLE_ID=MMETSP0052_2 /ASSEMBLY_ACC=CAM_ASM_000194 /LENGTH=453 /DNA_ID=CAMNT_0016302623 /DNA_START=67 /DNA_END=1425 /DNA_ORIENTATION=-